MTPSEFIRAIRIRASLLQLASPSHQEDAERQAARQLAQEGHRVELPPPATTAAQHEPGIRDRLVEMFIKLLDQQQRQSSDPLAQMFERKERAAAPTNTTKPKVKVVKQEVKPEAITPGVYAGNSPHGAKLIPDEEYHGMPDRTTSNWRKSIEDNERIEQERKEVWARRLEEIRGKQ